jgi:TPR repeat protein
MTAAPLTGRSPVTEQIQAPASLGPPPGLTGAELENARNLVQKGDENLEEGKISAARLFYRSAALSGHAPAALALGATYDASQLAKSNVVGGVQADPAEARKWYEKARELGSPEAERYLQALANR